MQVSTAVAHHIRPGGRRLGAVGALALAAGLLFSGCASTPGAPAGSTDQAPSEPAAAVTLPQTTAGIEIQWMVDLLNADSEITAQDLAGRFTKSFTEEAPLDTVAEQMNAGVRPGKPFVVTGYEDVSDVLGAARITGASGDSLSLEMRVEEDGTISEMLVRPAPAQ